MLIIVISSPVRAAGPWYVGPGGSDGATCLSPATRCASINGALNKAGFVAGDTIRVQTGTYTGSGNEVVLLDKDATLSGGWNSNFSTQNGTSTVDGQGARIGINVNGGVTASVDHFVVQNGQTGFGGGIRNNGTLTLNNSTVSNNEVSLGTARGGGIGNGGAMILNGTTISGNTSTFEGGGIYNRGSLILTNSIVSGNTVDVDGLGGGIYNDGGTMMLNNSTVNGNLGGGGGIYNDGGTMTLDDSTVSSNTNPNGGGGGIINSGAMTLNNTMVDGNLADNGGIGGGIINKGTMILNNSDTIGNMAASEAGGIYNSLLGNLTLNNSSVISNTTGVDEWSGGGIYVENGTVTLNDSTVSGNSATRSGGGIFMGGAMGTLILLNSSTVSNNMAKRGGGIDAEFGEFSTVTLQNTILAGNTTTGLGLSPDCYGNIGTAGYNLIGDTSGCTFTPNTGDWTNIDAKLGPLEGSPGYHPLLFDSPAINAGNPTGCMGSTGLLTTDQRGFARFGRCDIGAYEAQSIKTVNQPIALPGDSLIYTIALNNGGATNLSNLQVTDVLPTFLTYINNSLNATDGSYGFNDGTISWSGSINVGKTVTITFVATVEPTIGSIVNAAVINGGGETITRTATVNVQGQLCNLTKGSNNPVLSIGAGGTWDDDDVWRPMVLKEGGSYKMWYVADDGSNPSRLGLATSNNGLNWTKYGGNPVVSPGGGWEAGGLSGGSVIFDSGQYEMWYTGFDSSGVGRIGYATSPDGITWTKHGSNPVLDVGAVDSWEDADVMFPSVLKLGNTYHMWYEGNDGSGQSTHRIGHATSSNGITWVKDPANPVLDVGPPGDWDWLSAYGPNVIQYNNTFILWYSGQTLPKAWQTGYALSTNGTTWTRQRMLIPEGPPGAFDSDSADYASVIADGNDFKVWYSGYNGTNYTVGYATAQVCSTAGPDSSTELYLPIVLKGDSGSSCPAYYTDNFSDPSSGWPISDNGDRRYAYVGGEYQIWVKNPNKGWSVTPGAKATDFTASVSARRASGTTGGYGIIFGINEDWTQWYEFDIGVNSYSIWKYNNGYAPALQYWTYSPAVATGTNWNRLKVIRQGSSISVYVNNQLLSTVTDSSFTGFRRIGLTVGSGSVSNDVRFDNFSLYPASCGVGAAGVGFEMGQPEIHEAPAPPGGDGVP